MTDGDRLTADGSRLMSDGGYEARPGQSLADHLDGVAAKARRLAARGTTPRGDDWRTLVTTAAHLHDIGKYTPAFQSYLQADRHGPTLEERHADVGAIVTPLALLEQDISKQGALAGAVAVAHHHGRLPNVETEFTGSWERHQFEAVAAKLDDIEENASNLARERLETATGGAASWDRIHRTSWKRFEKLVHRLGRLDYDEEFYHTLVRLWGTLVCADRFDAAAAGDDSASDRTTADDTGITLSTDVPLPAETTFSFDTDASGDQRELNELRTSARETARERLLEHAPDASLFRLTLPTGFGKTAAGVEAAAALAEREGGRVVYALPFTTVVDQADSVLREQFGVSPADPEYTVHHHLAETRTDRDAADEPLADRTAVAHAEAWRAGVVLTTYVQLFESLVGPTSGRARKLPALRDAVILLDEPQAIPPDWWRAVSAVVDVLCRRDNATVIVQTATQPELFEAYGVGTPTELAPRERAFDFLEDHERVRFELDETVRQWAHDGAASTVAVTDAARRLLDATDAGTTGTHTDTDGTATHGTTAGQTLAVTATVDSVAGLVAAIERVSETDGSVTNLGDELSSWYSDAGSKPRQTVVGGDDTEDADTVAETFLDSAGTSAGSTGESAGDTVRETEGVTSAPVVVPLTAALRPVDRTVLVAAVRRLLDSETQTPFDDRPLIVVSTQMIEAGVDLSFDRVFRDLAPIPSLVQTAGRCNRSLEGTTGTVTVWRLDGDPVPSETIYGTEAATRASETDRSVPNRLRPTRFVLQTLARDQTSVSETTMVDELVTAYYEERHDADERAVETDRLVEAMHEAAAATLRDETMIPDDTTEVLVVSSDADRRALERYLDSQRDRFGDETGDDNETSPRTAGAAVHPLLARVYDVETLSTDTDDVLAEREETDRTALPFLIVDNSEGATYTLRDGLGLR